MRLEAVRRVGIGRAREAPAPFSHAGRTERANPAQPTASPASGAAPRNGMSRVARGCGVCATHSPTPPGVPRLVGMDWPRSGSRRRPSIAACALLPSPAVRPGADARRASLRKGYGTDRNGQTAYRRGPGRRRLARPAGSTDYDRHVSFDQRVAGPLCDNRVELSSAAGADLVGVPGRSPAGSSPGAGGRTGGGEADRAHLR